MDLIYIVPARGGSKRLPRKNIRPLAGRSLLAHTAQAVKDAGLPGEVLLSTDDVEMAEEGKRLGWLVPFLRPAELASDNATTMDVVLHALDWAKKQAKEQDNGADPEITVLLQPTSPLRGADCIRSAVDLLRSNPGSNSVIGMTRVHLPPQHFYTMGAEGNAQPLAAPGKAPVYYPNGAIYAAWTNRLWQCRTFYTDKTIILPMAAAQSVDIDTADEWDLAEAILEHRARKVGE